MGLCSLLLLLLVVTMMVLLLYPLFLLCPLLLWRRYVSPRATSSAHLWRSSRAASSTW